MLVLGLLFVWWCARGSFSSSSRSALSLLPVGRRQAAAAARALRPLLSRPEYQPRPKAPVGKGSRPEVGERSPGWGRAGGHRWPEDAEEEEAKEQRTSSLQRFSFSKRPSRAARGMRRIPGREQGAVRREQLERAAVPARCKGSRGARTEALKGGRRLRERRGARALLLLLLVVGALRV